MELTQKTFSERLERLRLLLDDKPDDFEELRVALHEKGVECAVIVPLVEVVLDFDTLTEVKYEQYSDTRYGQRFDFLLKDIFLIEVKELEANLDEHYKQVIAYIVDNDTINYGILTNGIEYQIWLQKTFIEATANCQLPHTPKVAKVLEVSLQSDGTQFVLDTLSIFKRDSYEQSFKTLAAIAGYYASGGRGRPPILHPDKQMNDMLRDRIRDAVVVQKGVYYEDVMNGKLATGDKLRFSNGCVQIMVEVTETGTIILKKDSANVVDMVQAIKDGWGAVIPLIADKWSKEDTEFQDPHEVIRLALNKQKLHRKEQYVFQPVSMSESS